MYCPQCQHQNSDAAKFCEECGTRLITLCPQCGHQASPTAKFCAECGNALTQGQKGKRGKGERTKEEGAKRRTGEKELITPSPSRIVAPSSPETCFLKAIEIAQKQQAKSLELRATMSLARLWQQQSKQHEAHRMVSEIYNWFTEGFETKDLQEAKALIKSLESSV